MAEETWGLNDPEVETFGMNDPVAAAQPSASSDDDHFTAQNEALAQLERNPRHSKAQKVLDLQRSLGLLPPELEFAHDAQNHFDITTGVGEDANPSLDITTGQGPHAFEEQNPTLDNYITKAEPEAKKSIRDNARELIELHREGRLALPDETLYKLHAATNEGTTPISTVVSGVKGTAEGLTDKSTPSKILGVLKSGASTVGNALSRFAVSALPTEEDDYDKALSKDVATGVIKGTGSLATLAGDVLSGGSNVAEQIAGDPKAEHDRIMRQISADKIAHTVNRAALAAGGDPDSDIAKVAEFAGQAAIPIGVEGAASKAIAKGADAAVEGGTKLAGLAAKGTGKAIPVVGPAAIAGAEYASGHPYAALITLARGYTPANHGWFGGLKHLIIDKGAEGAQAIGQAALDAPNGSTIVRTLQVQSSEEAHRIAGRIKAMTEELQTTAPDKLTRLYETDAKGNPLYDLEHLPKEAQEIRIEQLKLQKLTAGIKAMDPYVKGARIVSDMAKFGIGAAGNLGVAGATMGAIGAVSSTPDVAEEAAKEAVPVGAAIGLPGLYATTTHGKLAVNRDSLIAKSSGLKEDHPLYEDNQSALGQLNEGAKNYLATFSGLGHTEGKPFVALDSEGMKKALELEGEKVEKSPAGYAGKDYNYVNIDYLNRGVVPHEFIHGTGLDSNPDVVKAAEEMANSTDPDVIAKRDAALAKYEKAMQQTQPDFKLDKANMVKETAAALGADLMADLPPEAIYGGKSGRQIIQDWFKDKFTNKDKVTTTAQFGFPVTEGMKSALQTALFDLGERAKTGQAAVTLPSTELPKVAPRPVEDPIIKDAVDFAKSMGIKGAKDKVQAAYDESVKNGTTPTLPDLVKLAAQRTVPDLKSATITPPEGEKPLGGASAKPSTPFMPSIPSDKEVEQALSSDKREFVGNHRSLPDGSRIGVRIDIPAYERNGTYVQTIHEPKSGGQVGKRIGYDSMVNVDNPTFFANQKGSEKIRDGSPKFPVATVEGKFNSSRDLPTDIADWTDTGFNPKNHSYFYDKKTGEPVVSGDKAVMVGNSAFVKNPVYGKKSDFSYMPVEGEPIHPAVRADDMTFHGDDHDAALKAAKAYGISDKSLSKAQLGYTTKKGEFITEDGPSFMPPEGFEETTDQLRNPYKSDLSFVGKPGEQKIIDRISAQGFDGIRTPDGRNFKLQDDRKQEGLSHYMPAETIRKEGERLGLKYQGEEEGGTHLFRDPISKQDIKVPSDVPRGTIVKQVNDARAKNLADSMGFMPAPPPETPKFKEWFKDSKVVDNKGRPKIVLHGTASDFYAFKNDRLGAATKQVDTPLGFFFTEDPEGANYFAESAGKARAGLDRRDAYNGGSGVIPQGAAIVPAVLSIQKPYVFSTPHEFSQEMMGPLASIFGASRTPEEIRGIRDKLISQGYDGIKIVKGGHYMMGEDPNADVWVAFDPKQIKSAIGNRGTWSTKTSNITFMPSDLPEDRQSAVVDLKKQINTINNKLQRYVSDQKNPEALKLSDQKISLWKDIHKLRRGAVRDFGVIGSGPSGLESAASSAYEGLDTVLVDKNVRLGGQPKDSSRIENLYGTPQEGISGPEMTRNAVQKAKANGAEIRAGVGVKSLDYDPETGIKTLTYTNGEKERFHNVQISIGNEFKALDIPGAQYADNGNGRMAALHARGGDAIIVGGGNSASQAAIGAVEAGGVKHVYLFARSGVHGMSMSQAEQVAAHPNITIVKDELASISKKGDSLEVKTKNGDTYNVNGVGTFVGGKPNTEWLPKGIELDDKGKIVTKDNGETSIPGVFVAGDARSGSLPRINAASAQGQAVSTEVVRRITEKEKAWNKNNTSQIGTGLTTSQLPSEPNTSGLNKATLGDTRTLDTTTTESSPAKGSAMPSEPTVNVGLNVNDGSKITPEEAISELEKQGVKVTKQSVEQSNTEPTLIASLSRPLTPEEADNVSKALKQDAIAQFDGSKGELYGPKAEDWKPFNPDYFLNHKSSFMPSDLEDYISKIPVFKHERETNFISDTGDKAVAYRPSNKEQNIDQGPVWNGPDKPTDRLAFKEPSTTEKASFVRSERPLIITGKDQGNGEMSWNTDVVNRARKEGYDSVVVINDKAINGKGNIQDIVKSNPDNVDWENPLNLVIPLDDSIVSDKSGPNPDRVLDRYNSGELTKDQVSQKLSGNFMPAEEARISQRVPTAKKATEDAVSGNLKVGLDSIKTDPNFAKKLSDKVSEYIGFRSGGKDKLDDFVNQGADNLKWLYNQVPDEIKDRSKKWYDGANKIAHDLAAKYNQEPETTAAVLAALSPQNQWHNNVSLAERVLDISQNNTKEKWDEDMTQKMNEIFAGDKYKDIRDDIEGRSFSQLENNYLKAAWLRIYDEAKNPRDYKVVTPEGGRGETMMTGDQPARSMWFSLGPIEKALTVLQNPSRETISEQMGYSHKVRNFYNNIVAPNSKEGDYTSDTHNVAATLIKPLGGTANEVMDNFGKAGKNSVTGDKGTYGLYAEAGRRAAKDLGILPRQLQSVVWEAIRGMFSPEQKRDKNFIASIEKIWKDYENEKITLPEARAKILETSGGIRPPEWANGMAKDSQPSPDQRDVSELPVPRRSAKSAPSGNRRPAAAKSSKPLAHSRVDDELRRRGIASATM